MSKKLTLVLGGVRAGKSSYAQRLAESGEKVLFVATAEARDAEMEARINAHRESRPSDWDTLEEPLDLVAALEPVMHRYDTVLLDCLTLWVSNLMLLAVPEPPLQAGRAKEPGAARVDIPAEALRLLELYRNGSSSWIIVSNEVGLGVVPATELGRIYADELGRVNQLAAAEADDVYFMAAGLPMKMKSSDRRDDTAGG